MVDYYIDATNPYAAKYGREKDQWGDEAWKVQMRKSLVFYGIASITEMIKHIVFETQACFKNTEYSNTYHFYHDALSQLTCKETVNWTKSTTIPGGEQCIYNRWVRSENDLN